MPGLSRFFWILGIGAFDGDPTDAFTPPRGFRGKI